MNQYRQGDVLLIEVAELPDQVIGKPESNDPIVLARGEATGHTHAIRGSGAEMFNTASGVYLRATRPVNLEHEEHAAIQLRAGVYQVLLQKQYMATDPVQIARDEKRLERQRARD